MNHMKNRITAALTAAILTISFTVSTVAVEPQTVTPQDHPFKDCTMCGPSFDWTPIL